MPDFSLFYLAVTLHELDEALRNMVGHGLVRHLYIDELHVVCRIPFLVLCAVASYSSSCVTSFLSCCVVPSGTDEHEAMRSGDQNLAPGPGAVHPGQPSMVSQARAASASSVDSLGSLSTAQTSDYSYSPRCRQSCVLSGRRQISRLCRRISRKRKDSSKFSRAPSLLCWRLRTHFGASVRQPFGKLAPDTAGGSGAGY